MDEFRADLHCHTTCSDGTLSPSEVIDLAVQTGLKGLSITDHDSIDAYTTIMPYAAKSGIELISGVEFSTVHKGESIHVLAYSFSVNSPSISSLCSDHQKRRERRASRIIELLNKEGFEIAEEDIYGSRETKRGIGRPHIAQAMIDKGYVKDIKEAFRSYLGEGKKCYARDDLPSTEETLACIHEANGLAILAHPHLINNNGVLKGLLSMPFDGLECFYARFNISQNKRWTAIADLRGWLMTGGSDFHGDIKPMISLGSSWTREETFRKLQERHLINNR